MSCVSVALALFPVADPDLQIRGGGGGGGPPNTPGENGGGPHPDPEIRGGARSKKHFFRPFRPQFGLKIRGARASGPLP